MVSARCVHLLQVYKKPLSKYRTDTTMFCSNALSSFSDGQDIAIRLGKQLQTVTGKLRCFLTEINTLSDKEYIFKDVSELSSELLCDRDEGLQTNDEIFNLFVVLRRAEEEIELSKEDMISFINWIREQLQILNERLSVIDFGSSESRKAKGEKTLLLLLKMEFENQHIDTVSKFSKCLNVDLGVPQTDVMDFVMTCLSLGHLPDAIPDDDVSETLEVIDSYESEKADEPEIDDDSDDET